MSSQGCSVLLTESNLQIQELEGDSIDRRRIESVGTTNFNVHNPWLFKVAKRTSSSKGSKSVEAATSGSVRSLDDEDQAKWDQNAQSSWVHGPIDYGHAQLSISPENYIGQRLGGPEDTSITSDAPVDGLDRKKRLFVCCDGTWQNAVGANQLLADVARFARAISRTGLDGVVQIVYYVSGVGSGTDNTIDPSESIFHWMTNLPAPGKRLINDAIKYVGGSTGAGIRANLVNAYYFLCHNFNFRESKDDIILAGFSRGAYTAR